MSLIREVHPTSILLSHRIFPKHGLDPIKKRLKASSVYNGSFFFSFISLSNKTHSLWPSQTGLLKLHKLHGTIIVTPGLQHSLCLHTGTSLASSAWWNHFLGEGQMSISRFQSGTPNSISHT